MFNFFIPQISRASFDLVVKIASIVLILATPIPTTHAQISINSGSITSLETLMPDLLKADSVDKALNVLKPSLTKTQLLKSDYLLLDSPTIAPAGLMSVRLMSELPGTELFVLMNTSPAKGDSAILAAQEIPNMGKSDIRVKIKLEKSTELLLAVRAAGKWYSVSNDVKIATK